MLKFKHYGFAAALLGSVLYSHSSPTAMAQDAAPPQPQTAQAPDGSLARAAELIADRVAEYAKDFKQKRILVAEFKGNDLSAGRAIEIAVRERLQTQGGMTILKDEKDVAKQNGWTLEGRISVQPETGLATVKVALLDSTNSEIDSFKQEFNAPSSTVASQITPVAPPQPQTAEAHDGSLVRAAELIADRAAEYAKSRDQKTILVAEFKGNDLNAGRAIEIAVRERLQTQGGMTILKDEKDVVKQNGWTLEGRISVQLETGLATVKVDLLDSNNSEMDSFKQEVNAPSCTAGRQDVVVRVAKQEGKSSAELIKHPVPGVTAAKRPARKSVKATALRNRLRQSRSGYYIRPATK